MSETNPITAQRLLDHAASDHLRGCMGRQYSCTCEYDTITERLLVDAASRIQELEPKAAAYDACSSKIDCLSRGAVPVRDDGAEILVGLTAVIQYRNKRELGPWKTMAAFDVMGPAEKYFADQRTEADWPWEYRLVDLNEDTAK